MEDIQFTLLFSFFLFFYFQSKMGCLEDGHMVFDGKEPKPYTPTARPWLSTGAILSALGYLTWVHVWGLPSQTAGAQGAQHPMLLQPELLGVSAIALWPLYQGTFCIHTAPRIHLVLIRMNNGTSLIKVHILWSAPIPSHIPSLQLQQPRFTCIVACIAPLHTCRNVYPMVTHTKATVEICAH